MGIEGKRQDTDGRTWDYWMDRYGFPNISPGKESCKYERGESKQQNSIHQELRNNVCISTN